jgi:hypothetical protein
MAPVSITYKFFFSILTLLPLFLFIFLLSLGTGRDGRIWKEDRDEYFVHTSVTLHRYFFISFSDFSFSRGNWERGLIPDIPWGVRLFWDSIFFAKEEMETLA